MTGRYATIPDYYNAPVPEEPISRTYPGRFRVVAASQFTVVLQGMMSGLQPDELITISPEVWYEIGKPEFMSLVLTPLPSPQKHSFDVSGEEDSDD